ncbi:uncharacterized protein I303_105625 [Kwoniella dejecticola CBS 10117]|uniref:PhoD-like phosphatase metallophosphatase domain-containing protein n=1 Tax=Kwoniella dejecticola CBS 10117 TaxID=1296121 RepID=A0AAJ8KSN3_9TREE
MEIPATTSATDYTTNVPLDDLGPDTLYQYQLGRDISGTFTTRREEAEWLKDQKRRCFWGISFNLTYQLRCPTIQSPTTASFIVRCIPLIDQEKNSTAGFGGRSMLGAQQLRAMRDWVEQQGRREGRLLVFASGVPVTRNWSEGKDELDSWAGYLDEREVVLQEPWSVGGAVIISGDRHEHATTLLPPPIDSGYPSDSAVIEFSTSPLSFFHLPWTR